MILCQCQELVSLFIVLKWPDFLWLRMGRALKLKRWVADFWTIGIAENSFNVPASHQTVTCTYRDHPWRFISTLTICEKMSDWSCMVPAYGFYCHGIFLCVSVVVELQWTVTESDTNFGFRVWRNLNKAKCWPF